MTKKTKDDYYEILGVAKDASDEVIKKAYRKKAMEFHPDKNPGDKKSEDMFKKVSAAYEVLSDPSKKKQYDTGGDANSFYGFSGDPRDIFASFFGQGNFGFSFNQPTKRANRISPDTKGVCRVSLKDILAGTEMAIQLRRERACNKCFGVGYKETNLKCTTCGGTGTRGSRAGNMVISGTCNACQGTGEAMEKCTHCKGSGSHSFVEKIALTIPAGINQMSTLRIEGKGNETFEGTTPVTGNAYIVVDYPPQQNGVAIHNGDIYVSVNIPFTTVLNEEEVEIDILQCKKLKVKLNLHHHSGYVYKVEHGGLKENNSAFVKVLVDLPKNMISAENKQKLITLTKEVYGEPPTNFVPSTADNG